MIRINIPATSIWAVFGTKVFGNTIQDYLIFTAAFFALIAAMSFFRNVVLHKMEKLAQRTKNLTDDFIIAQLRLLGWPLYGIISIHLSLTLLSVPGSISRLVWYATLLVAIYYLGKSVHEVIDFGTRRIIEMKQQKEEEFDHTIIFFFGKALKVFFWAGVILLLVSYLGYNITGIAAGLGIGGIAIAFALQNVLKDLFSSLSIYFDKPFQLGDYIVVGDDAGVVRNIGLKSTRIQTSRGEELVVSNSELTSTRIHNFKRLERRRTVFTLGVTYETPYSKLEKIPKLIASIFEKVDGADLDRVHFKEYGDSALKFEIAYYVDSGDYTTYLDINQRLNLAIKKAFDKNKIDFAYPTQTVLVKK